MVAAPVWARQRTECNNNNYMQVNIHNEYQQRKRQLILPLAPLTATFTNSSMVDVPSTSSFFFIASGKAWKRNKQDSFLRKSHNEMFKVDDSLCSSSYFISAKCRAKALVPRDNTSHKLKKPQWWHWQGKGLRKKGGMGSELGKRSLHTTRKNPLTKLTFPPFSTITGASRLPSSTVMADTAATTAPLTWQAMPNNETQNYDCLFLRELFNGWMTILHDRNDYDEFLTDNVSLGWT